MRFSKTPQLLGMTLLFGLGACATTRGAHPIDASEAHSCFRGVCQPMTEAADSIEVFMSDAASGLVLVHAYRGTVIEHGQSVPAEWHLAGPGHLVLAWTTPDGEHWRSELDQRGSELDGTASVSTDSLASAEKRALRLQRIECSSVSGKLGGTAEQRAQ